MIEKLCKKISPYLFFFMLLGLVAEQCFEGTVLYPYIEKAAMPTVMLYFITLVWPVAFGGDDEE